LTAGRRKAGGHTLAATLALTVAIFAAPAYALSELPQEEAPEEAPITLVPLPDPIPNPGNPAPATPPEAPPGEEAAPPELEDGDGTPPAGQAAEVLPEVIYDLNRLPEPVRTLREKIVAACKAGDLEALRPLISTGEDGTTLSLVGLEGDAIQFIKELSGDGEGHEILAILEEVLEAGYVHLEPGTDGEIYVWPYFFALPLDSLTAPQRVELFRLVTAGDYEDMKNYGAYIFYRVGITPQGKWAFFVAGD
jgi:hypothetical protein